MQIILGDIQWPMVSAIAASVGVIVALFFYILNLIITRRSNSAKMVLDLVNLFNSSDMRKQRGRFAKALLDENIKIDLRRDAPVLEFFEEIGYMARRKVLDKGMVWNSFSWWLEPYYLAVTNKHNKNLIEEARSDLQSRSLFCEIEWLYKIMCEVGLKEEGVKTHIPPSTTYILEFLDEESKLDVAELQAASQPIVSPNTQSSGARPTEASITPNTSGRAR